MKAHLVTGALGLVGVAVVEALAARGDRVIAMDRQSGTIGAVDVAGCDLRDVHRLYALVRDVPLDSVIHCGAHSGPMIARDNPFDLVAVNVLGTANVLELARASRVRRFVYCSSVSVYGPTAAGPVREDARLAPSTVYGATKMAAEAIVTAYAREHGLDAVSFRLSWVYGPNRKTPCLLGRMIRDALAGRGTRVEWGADFPRQYIDAGDAAAGLVAGLDAPELSSRVYNLTGGDYRTLGEVAALVRAVLPGADISLEKGVDPGDDLQHEFDISAARRDLGYRPAISLEQGIARFAGELRRQSYEGSA
jgi:nucleoside-diphosphate-sugar epimerase